MDHLPAYEFQKCVARYDGDYEFRGFSCGDQVLALAFAQLTYRESLRDIEACLRAASGKLYHMGFRGKISRSTLADANEAHDWRIFADFAQVLIHLARSFDAFMPGELQGQFSTHIKATAHVTAQFQQRRHIGERVHGPSGRLRRQYEL